MIPQQDYYSNMKDIISFSLLLGAFIIASAFLHWLVQVSGLDGFPAFLLSCIPLLGVISYTTCAPGESFLQSMKRNAFWGFSFILPIAGLAWLI
jgi:hypothetical protein